MPTSILQCGFRNISSAKFGGLGMGGRFPQLKDAKTGSRAWWSLQAGQGLCLPWVHKPPSDRCCCWMDPGAVRSPKACISRGKKGSQNYYFSGFSAECNLQIPLEMGFIVGLHESGIFVCSMLQRASFLRLLALKM